MAVQTTYDRLLADIAAIPEQMPDLVQVPDYWSRYVSGQLLLSLTAEEVAELSAGGFPRWACLNGTYRLTDIRHFADDFAALTFDGVYDMQRLALEYQVLPQVELSGPNGLGYDGPRIFVGRAGDGFHYFVQDAWGDCPAGCIRQPWLEGGWGEGRLAPLARARTRRSGWPSAIQAKLRVP